MMARMSHSSYAVKLCVSRACWAAEELVWCLETWAWWSRPERTPAIHWYRLQKQGETRVFDSNRVTLICCSTDGGTRCLAVRWVC